MSPLELGIIFECLRCPASVEMDEWYSLELPSRSADSVPTPAPGFIACADCFASAAAADVVLLPGGAGMPRAHDERLTAATRTAYANGARLVATSSRIFDLAAAGLLDARRATVHWRLRDAFAQLYPQVRLEADAIYVIDGRIATGAGGASTLDLLLQLVRQDYGARIAGEIAQRLIAPPRRAGGYVQPRAEATPPRDEPIEELLAWMRANRQQPMTPAVLAERVGMSTRTFHRRFRGLTGSTPHRWDLDARMEQACQLLDQPGANFADVAAEVGLARAVLRRELRRRARAGPDRSQFEGPA